MELIFIGLDSVSITRVDDTIQTDGVLSLGEAISILKLEVGDIEHGWYRVDTGEFLGLTLPEDFL